MIGLRVETEVAMLKRTLHRAFALGWIGMFGVLMIPGPASGRTAQDELESIGIEPIAAEEGWEQDLTSEDEAALRAWVASMENDDASPMEEDYPVKRSCLNEPYVCPKHSNCKINGEDAVCLIKDCGEGKCGICPDFLSKLLITGWCAYGCKVDRKIVGGAFRFKHPFPKNNGNTEPFCIDKDGKRQ